MEKREARPDRPHPVKPTRAVFQIFFSASAEWCLFLILGSSSHTKKVKRWIYLLHSPAVKPNSLYHVLGGRKVLCKNCVIPAHFSVSFDSPWALGSKRLFFFFIFSTANLVHTKNLGNSGAFLCANGLKDLCAGQDWGEGRKWACLNRNLRHSEVCPSTWNSEALRRWLDLGGGPEYLQPQTSWFFSSRSPWTCPFPSASTPMLAILMHLRWWRRMEIWFFYAVFGSVHPALQKREMLWNLCCLQACSSTYPLLKTAIYHARLVFSSLEVGKSDVAFKIIVKGWPWWSSG